MEWSPALYLMIMMILMMRVCICRIRSASIEEFLYTTQSVYKIRIITIFGCLIKLRARGVSNRLRYIFFSIRLICCCWCMLWINMLCYVMNFRAACTFLFSFYCTEFRNSSKFPIIRLCYDELIENDNTQVDIFRGRLAFLEMFVWIRMCQCLNRTTTTNIHQNAPKTDFCFFDWFILNVSAVCRSYVCYLLSLFTALNFSFIFICMWISAP